MKTTIDRAGRLVIPKAIRETAGLVPGLDLEVRCRDGIVEIVPVCADIKLVRKGSLLVAHAPGAPTLTQKQVNKLLRDTRERRLEMESGSLFSASRRLSSEKTP